MYECQQVSCGWEHTAAVMKSGDLYMWGSSKYGAIGTTSKQDAWSPVKFELKIGKIRENSNYSSFQSTNLEIRFVSCGSRFT